MTNEERLSSYLCSACGESINMRRNNYRVVGISVPHEWYLGERGEPPTSVYKHKHCMDADEWKTDESAAA